MAEKEYEVLGCAIYNAKYAARGGRWEAVETREVWYDLARRIIESQDILGLIGSWPSSEPEVALSPPLMPLEEIEVELRSDDHLSDAALRSWADKICRRLSQWSYRLKQEHGVYHDDAVLLDDAQVLICELIEDEERE